MVLEAARKATPERILRALAINCRWWEIGTYLRRRKIAAQGQASVRTWLQKASLADLQEVVVFAELDNGPDDNFVAFFGVDEKRIHLEAEKRARAALKETVQTSAQKPKAKSPAKPKAGRAKTPSKRAGR